ncbi:MAG TPA: hypothetical protein VNW26_01405 [Steroidobacteraceae bacterium]|nr:hypothetical protein [Steroidobacteraceae bacterium]
MISEWMKVMLEEISRKKADAEQALAEEQRRAEEQRCRDESSASAPSGAALPREKRRL